jgi:hypothetical protein
LLAGALLAPTTYGPLTRELWLVIAVIAACLAIVLLPLPSRLLVWLLLGLVIVDGVREINDYRLLGRISPWRASPSDVAPYRARDGQVRKLPALLRQAPASRPAREPPVASLASSPTGSDPDATGWIADGYHLIDYGGTLERVLWQVEHEPALLSLMLAPWHGYTFPCGTVGCSDRTVHLPAAKAWRPSAQIQTLSYGPNHITYAVNLSQPELMVENELAIPGWSSSAPQVRPVSAGIPLRAWRLSPGRYTFTATYRERGRTLQEMVVAGALIAWLACAIALRRKRKVAAA